MHSKPVQKNRRFVRKNLSLEKSTVQKNRHGRQKKATAVKGKLGVSTVKKIDGQDTPAVIVELFRN